MFDETENKRSDLEGLEKSKLFTDLALEIFPRDSWKNWEIKSLKRLGLDRWFGVDDIDTEDY